ncbi:hypothetical protein BASA60_007917 [Batrachochytrium salamandrivorans]|nr:hypothetical protein BASA60_007917 [Batrachochytrium salamandrivorans]
MTIMALYWFVEQESPDNKVVLWSALMRNKKDRSLRDSGASGGGSSPNLPSDNNGLGNPGKPQRNAKGFGASLKKGLANQKQKYVQWSDEKTYQNSR